MSKGGSLGADAEAVGTIVAVWLAFVRPFTYKQRERRRRRRAMNMWLFGEKGVPGISDDTLSAPEMIAGIQSDVGVLKTDVAALKESNVTILQRLNELVTVAHNTNAKITSNGGSSNTLGDLAQRHARKDGTWIEGADNGDAA